MSKYLPALGLSDEVARIVRPDSWTRVDIAFLIRFIPHVVRQTPGSSKRAGSC